MARIAGVDLPREKRVEIGLTYNLWSRFINFTKNLSYNRNKSRYKNQGFI